MHQSVFSNTVSHHNLTVLQLHLGYYKNETLCAREFQYLQITGNKIQDCITVTEGRHRYGGLQVRQALTTTDTESWVRGGRLKRLFYFVLYLKFSIIKKMKEKNPTDNLFRPLTGRAHHHKDDLSWQAEGHSQRHTGGLSDPIKKKKKNAGKHTNKDK